MHFRYIKIGLLNGVSQRTNLRIVGQRNRRMRLRRNCLWALMPLGAMALSALATQTSAQEPVTQPRAVVPEAAVGTTQSDQGPDGTINVRTDTYQVTGSSYKDLWSSVQRAAMENGPEMGIGEASISFQPRANFGRIAEQTGRGDLSCQFV